MGKKAMHTAVKLNIICARIYTEGYGNEDVKKSETNLRSLYVAVIDRYVR
jgi:hypothetical protein